MSKYYSNPLPAFKEFRSAVRIRVRDMCGMDPEELGDFPMWDAFLDGLSIEETAEGILEEAGFDAVWALDQDA